MSDKSDSGNSLSTKDGSNFASLASEYGVVVHSDASRPKFDTSLQARTPSAVASRQNPSTDLDSAVTAAVRPSPISSNQKKRSSRSIDDSAGDILEQICSQMNTLSTQDSNNDKIAAFMSVLACAHSEAAFFLESADWSVEAAVSLWLESGVGATLADNNKRSRSMPHGDEGRQQYARQRVYIEALPEEWSAWVSTTSGHIYFLHEESGHTQNSVPPGFADIHSTEIREQVSHNNGNFSSTSSMNQEDDIEDEDNTHQIEMAFTNAMENESEHGRNNEGVVDSTSTVCNIDASVRINSEEGGNPSPISDGKTNRSSQSAASAGSLGNITSYSDLSGHGGGSGDSDRMF